MKIQDLGNVLVSPETSKRASQPDFDRWEVANTPDSETGQVQSFSPLAQFAYSHEISELVYSENTTKFVYRSKDNSLAMRASSQTDVYVGIEKTSLEFTFTAEALGLTAKDFEATGGQPIRFSYSFEQTDVRVQYSSSTTLRHTIRKPGEILTDIVKALRKALTKGGDRKIALWLDDEALQVLLADEKFAKLFKELVGLIDMLNSFRVSLRNNFADSIGKTWQKTRGYSFTSPKRGEGGWERHNILISGKGKPYLEHHERTTINVSQRSFEFTFTILPPAEKQITDASDDVATEPEAVEVSD